MGRGLEFEVKANPSPSSLQIAVAVVHIGWSGGASKPRGPNPPLAAKARRSG